MLGRGKATSCWCCGHAGQGGREFLDSGGVERGEHQWQTLQPILTSV